MLSSDLLVQLRRRLPASPLTRFAPAPTGYLHLGHVVNAVHVWGLARALGGRFGRSALHAIPASDPDPGHITDLRGLAGFSLIAGLPEFAVGRIQFEGTALDGTLSWRLTGTTGFRYLLEKREEGSHWKPDRVFESVQGSVIFSTPISEDTSVLYRARILD